MTGGHLSLQNVSKSFPGTEAVRGVSLDMERGEFFAILGPSGCGKTTLLRLIAGFERPSSGKIILDGKDVTALPPAGRGIGMVFQNYALFPHMNVLRNVAYGLDVRGLPAAEVRSRVEKVLAVVGLGGKHDSPVSSLSGGEQQRVALARALVVEPALLLLDEPLSNLDVTLREQTREELRSIQRSVGITAIYVTHDQGEALSLSDRLAIMRAGVVLQVGDPRSVYESPETPFVANFLGRANIVRATDGVTFPSGIASRVGASGCAAIRPDAIVLSTLPSASPVRGRVSGVEYQGFTTEVVVRVGRIDLRVAMLSGAVPAGLAPGSEVSLAIDWDRVRLFPDGAA